MLRHRIMYLNGRNISWTSGPFLLLQAIIEWSKTSVPRRYVLTMTIDSQMKIYSVFLNFA